MYVTLIAVKFAIILFFEIEGHWLLPAKMLEPVLESPKMETGHVSHYIFDASHKVKHYVSSNFMPLQHHKDLFFKFQIVSKEERATKSKMHPEKELIHKVQKKIQARQMAPACDPSTEGG